MCGGNSTEGSNPSLSAIFKENANPLLDSNPRRGFDEAKRLHFNETDMSDPYTNPDALPEPAIQALITRLEERGRDRRFLQMIQNYVETLPNDRPLKVLDLGCGTGVVVRLLANTLSPSSTIHGADVSAVFLKEAARLSPNIEAQWDHVSPEKLPYAESTFDAITMHTLLSHVPDPEHLLNEARRVLKKSGRLIVFDADHAGTTFSLPDYATTRRIDHLLTSAIATHPDICRQLPRLLEMSGFKLLDHAAEVIAECGKGDYWLSSVRGFAKLLPSIDHLSAKEGESWVNQMMQSHEDGTFFAAGTFYTFYAEPKTNQGV